ncbi:hypothetical protein lacNasYZ03_18400 [Lactobacillus nasalidis]|uniref:HTH lysR-type domain-containing protein n=1 Tax=Lactobacillus nasalidis TaxID=2797258 RepID=A0ABQ3W6H0_9LACO|nr:LysR family transcriptional regulator [Lactobacillus nasalidis]GHV98082.1 hypothetical protein lacNasYZ01_12640 [Lactobacillus nasalidis]GHV99721.1 hypothetical protein lacNasYZ02_11510 [Lactobacillus nasalidis]GHW02153.1 hypothetical protein lacNasYZ03_18400 [Lactobacillus nasalidis]
MYLEHLTTFVNLAETLNFSKTAINLNMSQSSVSQAIASIEKQLGVSLFYRSRKAVSLTPAGRDFYDRIKPWLNEYNKSVQHVQQVQAQQQMNLTIGYSGTPYENTVIPQLVREFCKEHPQISVFLENYAHKELKEHLAHGNCDLIFTMPDIIDGNDNFKYSSLLVGYYCLIIPKESKALPTPVDLSALGQGRLIFSDHRWCPPTQDQLQKEISKSNPSLNLAYANNIATAHAMVKAHLGWGIWANFVSDPNDDDLVKLPLATNIIPDYGVAILKQGSPRAAKQFVSWLEKTGLPG